MTGQSNCRPFALSVPGMKVENLDERERKVQESPEIPLTSAPLRASIHQIFSACRFYMEDYMLCKRANGNPETCINQNVLMNKCIYEAVDFLKEECNELFEKYWKCLDMNNHKHFMCRDEERAFNLCAKEKCVSIELGNSFESMRLLSNF
jgi:hypothetical protein